MLTMWFTNSISIYLFVILFSINKKKPEFSVSSDNRPMFPPKGRKFIFRRLRLPFLFTFTKMVCSTIYLLPTWTNPCNAVSFTVPKGTALVASTVERIAIPRRAGNAMLGHTMPGRPHLLSHSTDMKSCNDFICVIDSVRSIRLVTEEEMAQINEYLMRGL